jgi:hypothetical protein
MTSWPPRHPHAIHNEINRVSAMFLVGVESLQGGAPASYNDLPEGESGNTSRQPGSGFQPPALQCPVERREKRSPGKSNQETAQ